MTSAEDTTAAGTQSDARQFSIFTVMWAVAGWFHLWNQVPWPKKVWWSPDAGQLVMEGLVLAAAWGVLARPGNAKVFLAFVLLEALHGLLDLPRVANHWYITCLVDLAMLGSAAVVYRRDGELDGVAWFRHFAPGARGIVWLAYTFAALAKLNTDFLDPSVSCASTTWVLMGKESFHWLPQGAFWEWNAIIATVVAELSIPCLLLIPRWRHVGVLVGVAFHYLISLPPQLHVPDFASMLFAWWLLFLPNTVADRMAERWASLRALFPILAGMRSMVVITPLVFLPMLWFAWGPSNDPVANALFGLRLVAFGVLGAFWAIWLLLTLRDEEGRVEDRDVPRPQHAWHLALLVVVFASGLTPYLGLRTTTNFTMFSNLRTEGQVANHLLFPQVYLTDHQLDLVEIVESSSRRLQLVKAKGARMPWWELRYRIWEEPEASVTFRRNGEEVVVERGGDHPLFQDPPGFLERRLLAFRPVDAGDLSTCQW